MLAETFKHLIAKEKERKEVLLIRKQDLETELNNLRAQFKAGDIEKLHLKFAATSKKLEEVEKKLDKIGKNFSPRELLKTCHSIEKIWDELFPAERYRLAHLLINKITLYTDRIVMDIRHAGINSLIKELKADEEVMVSIPNENDSCENIIHLTVPMVIRRRHGHKLILAPDGNEQTFSEIQDKQHGPSSLALHLSRAYVWMDALEAGKAKTISQLAEIIGMDQSYMSKTVKLVNLSPEIQKMIMEGTEPESLTLAKLRHEIPADWMEQRKKYSQIVKIK